MTKKDNNRKRKLTKKEKIDKLKEELVLFEERLMKATVSLDVDKRRVEIAEKILEIKKKFNKVLLGKPEYMNKQEFWDLVNEDEVLSFTHIYKPQVDIGLKRSEDDIKGLKAAIAQIQKELKNGRK